MKYILNIPKPCGENWDKMTPTDKGKFCSICDKEIFDFTNHTKQQIINKIENGDNICGKFKSSQLNQSLHSEKNNLLSKMLVLLGLTSLVSISQPIHSQSNKNLTELSSKQGVKLKDTVKIINDKDSVLIRGMVIDDFKFPLPGTHINLKNSKTISTYTDFDGNFSLNIPNEYFDDEVLLEVGFIGMETQEIKVYRKSEFLNIELKQSDTLMGEVVIIKKQNIFRRIGNLFRKKD